MKVKSRAIICLVALCIGALAGCTTTNKGNTNEQCGTEGSKSFVKGNTDTSSGMIIDGCWGTKDSSEVQSDESSTVTGG